MQAAEWDNGTISWVFFDVGETLVDESKPIRESIRQFVEQAAKLGYRIEPHIVEQALMHYHGLFSSFPMRDVMEQLIRSEEDRLEIRKGMVYRKDWDEPFADAVGILEQLSRHYKLGIIANQSAGTAARLEQYGMLKYISVVCSSAEEGLSKPDVRFYERALGEARCKAEHAVMIGDRIDNDVIPAKRVGMRAIWVRQGLARHQPIPLDHTAPDVMVERLDGIMNYLARI
ncbi:putative hydrolase of the HAD superfamily [Paenibacillus sp. 1_12]|uniref:HAD family hydrolase n=1 Tax=Paenibacillus sp. 1_12 TaxID=1566278 RepID=UPI0008E0F368|nr:HAD family hydrolase [Paenibacillus sp. 1_12]SFK94541.1 putative hydrolase of the HAD superfamily [Paenibacillus sp. 1_12]